METETLDVSPAPAAPPLEVVDSAPTPEPVEVQTEQGDDTAPTPVPKWVKPRIDELTRNWREEQRRSEALLALIQQQKAPEPEVEAPQKEPELADFDYDEGKYRQAVIKYAQEQARAVVQQELQQRDWQSQQMTRVQTFESREAEFAKAHPDYHERVVQDSTLPITPAMREVLFDSPNGPEVAYWLAQNRENAAQIARLPPHQAALELGRIEGRLAAIKEVKSRPVPVVSSAPPPPPQIEASDAGVEKDPSQMTDAEFAKWRKRQIAQRR